MEKGNIILVVVLVIVGLMAVDFFDFNERFGFPISVVDEPLLIIFGIILGYLIAKFRFLKMIKKKIGKSL